MSESTKKDTPTAYLEEIGRKGGSKHSREHMAELGRKSAEKRRQLKEERLNSE